MISLKKLTDLPLEERPREVFSDVVAERASAVIIAHNHPVGDLTTSKEDREITVKIKAAGEVLEVKLLDRTIFNRENYFSFIENLSSSAATTKKVSITRYLDRCAPLAYI